MMTIFMSSRKCFASTVRGKSISTKWRDTTHGWIPLRQRCSELSFLLDQWREARREVARRYHLGLSSVRGILLPSEALGAKHVYHQYTVRILDGATDRVRGRLQEQAIGSMIYYPVVLHKQPPYDQAGEQHAVAEEAAQQVLSLPMGPFLSPSDQERVIEAMKIGLV
ncbi:MAG: DegT/DnrJ/EryC1/StrS family aminotransferase [Nitrososphaeraceae archaeon]